MNYKGEISLHFDLPSLYSCRAWSLWHLLKFACVGNLGEARFIKLLNVDSSF